MSEKNIYIEIVGPDAEEGANALSETIKKEFNSRPVKFDPKETVSPESAGKKTNPILIGTVAAVISAGLAFPAAVIATVQIKDRLAKKKSFEGLIEKGKKLKKTKRITKIKLRIGKMEVDIEKATFAEISDAIN